MPSPVTRAAEAAQQWLRNVRPDRRYTKQDVLAGLPGAISSVPDGMASSVLAGVNPVYGLYASGFGPVAGGLAAHNRLMVITTTSAAALAAGSALSGIDAADKSSSLFLLTVLAGVAMIVAGVLKLGRYTRFVSDSVMLGFLTGVAINIIAGQIPDLLGVDASGSFATQKALDALRHIGDADPATFLIGMFALAIVVALDRTPAKLIGAVVALVLPTLVVAIFGLDSVARVEDVGDIPAGLPLPAIPDLGLLSLDLIAGALAIAAIVLVQGAGVSQSAPNPDGTIDANQDFAAQGIANVAAGVFKGIPVGGSMGQTALNVAAGARTRWGAIYSGLWMLVILLLLSQAVGVVAMPTLAAVLVYAASSSLRFDRIATVLKTNLISRTAMISTLVATLLLPVAAAVGIGVALSLLLQLNREALDLAVMQRVRRPDGHVEERPAPEVLPSNEVTELVVYGSLFYAGARTLQVRLPDPTGTVGPVVVLRLRGRTSVGATFLAVLSDYADRLDDAGGQLFVSGLDPDIMDLMERTGHLNGAAAIHLFEASPVVGESTERAVAEATTWLVAHRRG